MEITINTPALLFPCISLLLLAYTNRFLAIANRIRGLKSQYTSAHEPHILKQISNLRRRVLIIRNMQAFAIASLFCCILCMFLLFWSDELLAKYVFALSLLLMMVSLILSLMEIAISVNALKIELKDLEEDLEKENKFLE